MSVLEESKKIALLEEYCLSLERENFAKNNQTSLLYSQLESLKEENCMLKSFIDTMKINWEEERQLLNQRLEQKEQEANARNFGEELRNSVDIGSLKAVAEDMRQQLESRDEYISDLTHEKQQLEMELDKLKQQLRESAYKVVRSQQKLRQQMQLAKQLQTEIYGLRNSRMENKSAVSVSFAKLEVDKLVRQNNELIQRIRILEKEKNGYYHQLKMTSPLKSRNLNIRDSDSKSISKRNTQSKPDRKSVMQEKLRAIRSENQQLKANLAII